MNLIDWYVNHLNKKVEQFAKVYMFDMGNDGKTSWNNEGDAFKHTYMQAELCLWLGCTLAKVIGDFHEAKPNNPKNERNMDLWNNEKGREIAEIIKKMDPFWMIAYKDTECIIAKLIVDRINSGLLITNPNDTRVFDDNL